MGKFSMIYTMVMATQPFRRNPAAVIIGRKSETSEAWSDYHCDLSRMLSLPHSHFMGILMCLIVSTVHYLPPESRRKGREIEGERVGNIERERKDCLLLNRRWHVVKHEHLRKTGIMMSFFYGWFTMHWTIRLVEDFLCFIFLLAATQWN